MAAKSFLLVNIFGWLCLGFGVLLYVIPIFHKWLGFYSGLLAFILIFIGISLLKYRKDQMNQ